MEESLEGWQEFELEVMSDTAGNCVVVCSIENLDPMGVHTGDSWTVAPQQTLPDAEYQRLREAAFACARAVGVATGGANVQFAYEPETRELRVIEMNPRVSRSSALASKATGFPIAKLAALLAIGYTLDELPNDITQQTTAAFEPALDYVAVKAPRFDFAKFPEADDHLGSEMRAVGEALGLGRTFPEAFLKAMDGREWTPPTLDLARRGEPVPERWDLLLEAARQGLDLPGIHPYFAQQLRDIATAEAGCADIVAAKRFGLPDAAIARALGVAEADVRAQRPLPGRLAVDSCAAEFEAETPYFYLSYEPSDAEPKPTGNAVIVLGSGPNRIGQGIEFDYCCVHAAQTFRALGYEAVLVNPNPETVSTDYDTSDRLYLEPLTLERTLDVCALEQPLGVVVSFGGQTPSGLRRASTTRESRSSATRCRRSTPPRTASASPNCSTSSGCARRPGAQPSTRPSAHGCRRARLPRARSSAPRDRRARHPRRAKRRRARRSMVRVSSIAFSRTRSSSTSTSSATDGTRGWPRSSNTSSGRVAIREIRPRPPRAERDRAARGGDPRCRDRDRARRSAPAAC